MNPHLRTRADSNIMSLIKHLSQKWRTNDGQCVDRDIKNVAFSVKTACTLFIGCDGPSCLAAPLTAGKLYRLLFHCWCQQCVWGLDLQQTGSQSLSSQQPTSLSATLAVTKSIMFSLLCHLQHGGVVVVGVGGGGWRCLSIFYSFSWAEWCLQSGQHAKQTEKVYLFENLG